jgi:hypothetical protein
VHSPVTELRREDFPTLGKPANAQNTIGGMGEGGGQKQEKKRLLNNRHDLRHKFHRTTRRWRLTNEGHSSVSCTANVKSDPLTSATLGWLKQLGAGKGRGKGKGTSQSQTRHAITCGRPQSALTPRQALPCPPLTTHLSSKLRQACLQLPQVVLSGFVLLRAGDLRL